MSINVTPAGCVTSVSLTIAGKQEYCTPAGITNEESLAPAVLPELAVDSGIAI